MKDLNYYKGYSKLLEEFIDEMENQGKISDEDINNFIKMKTERFIALKTEAKKFVDENFKGMF